MHTCPALRTEYMYRCTQRMRMVLISRTTPPEYNGGYVLRIPFIPFHSNATITKRQVGFCTCGSLTLAYRLFRVQSLGSVFLFLVWECFLHSVAWEQMLPVSYSTVLYRTIPYRTGNTRSSVTNLFDLISGSTTPYSTSTTTTEYVPLLSSQLYLSLVSVSILSLLSRISHPPRSTCMCRQLRREYTHRSLRITSFPIRLALSPPIVLVAG